MGSCRSLVKFAALVVSVCVVYLVRVHALPTAPDEVAVAIEADGLLTIEARINGAGPFRLLLDTGSSMSSVSRTLMRTLQLAPSATADLLTPAGARARDVVRLDVMSLGTASRRGVLATVLEDRDLAALGPDVDGIVGQNFLAELHYAIDYRRKRLSWTADGGRSAAADATLPLKLADGRWLAGLPQGKDGRMLWFVPDSGAAALVLYHRGQTPALKTRQPSCCAGVNTVNGSALARIAVVPEFKVGSIVIRNWPVLIVDRTSGHPPVGDGLLPLSLFSSVSFEPGRQVLRVVY